VKLALCLLAACAGGEVPAPVAPTPRPPPDAAIDAPADAAPVSLLPPDAAPAGDEPWLKGSTHVHARPSGDSTEPIEGVVRWYVAHGYDFIALTDHNKVSELGAASTAGQVALGSPGLIVLSGVELTHNPSGCLPPGDPSGKCRIHVNALGVTARPPGKIDWADRKTHDRLAKYQAALAEARALGARVVQINHPQWYWGMTTDILAELARRGAQLVEIANVQFPTWNAGDADHPGTEALWDGALAQGVTLWGVASDDAHSYGVAKGKWPAGGGWVMVHARRDPQAILDALAAGRFYASTGVVLARDELDGDDYVIEAEPGSYTITWIENGAVVDTVHGAAARRALPQAGYLRADIVRDDGARAWVQPMRR